VLVNLFVGIALLVSVLLFSSKKFGLYFRVHESVSKADNIRLDFIKDYLRDEYHRREEPYLLDSIYDSLATVMKLDRFEVMQLVEKATRKHAELRIDGLLRSEPMSPFFSSIFNTLSFQSFRNEEVK
jgi:hypothetical protein